MTVVFMNKGTNLRNQVANLLLSYKLGSRTQLSDSTLKTQHYTCTAVLVSQLQ